MTLEDPHPASHRIERDSLWGGRLRLSQPARGAGYRFNLDPVFLAGFVAPAVHVIDLGAGCGILGLLMLKLGRAGRVTAVERQGLLATTARINGADNGFEPGQYDVLAGDLRYLDLPRADGVVFNPPYFRDETGRPAPNHGRDAARHERHGTLADFVAVAVSRLLPGGILSAIVPATREEELRNLCLAAGLAEMRRRFVEPRAGEPAIRAMLAASHGEHQLLDEPPLVVHGADRDFTSEVRALVDGPGPERHQEVPRRAR